MIATLWLITEDENDFEAMKRFLKQRGINVTVRSRKLNGNRGGISRLAEQLDELITTISDLMTSHDCIVVLHDADEFTRPDDRADYEKIAAICQKHRQFVRELIARDELESWILADSGFCKWIGYAPQNWDRERRPSDRLRKLMKAKTGADYGGRYRDQLVANIAGDGDKLSLSMQEAFAALAELECVKI